MHTLCKHLAAQFAQAISRWPAQAGSGLLLTGGGTKNNFLVQCIREALAPRLSVYVPRVEVLDFKEALIFAFLGLLRMQEKTNTLASATGAKADSSGGVIYRGSS
jgi:anhydro-N-acetylmuramic acid kinase